MIEPAHIAAWFSVSWIALASVARGIEKWKRRRAVSAIIAAHTAEARAMGAKATGPRLGRP